MTPQDAKTWLLGAGVKGLKLKSVDNDKYDFTYTSARQSVLDKAFGEAVLAANGTVAVYVIPGIAKIGYNPTKGLIRLIDLTRTQEIKTNEAHLAQIELPPALVQSFFVAGAEPETRGVFLRKLWTYFNKEKFHARMKLPKISLAPTLKNARGQFTFYPSDPSKNTLSIAPYVFRAPIQFLVNTMLHEMAHQADRTLDGNLDNSLAGHGPGWQKWMRAIGLEPRQYDESDNLVYMDTNDRLKEQLYRKSRIKLRAP